MDDKSSRYLHPRLQGLEVTDLVDLDVNNLFCDLQDEISRRGGARALEAAIREVEEGAEEIHRHHVETA